MMDSGISSLDAVAFFRLVMREFDIPVRPDAVSRISSWKSLIEYVDENAS